jgi:hypothetical protein
MAREAQSHVPQGRGRQWKFSARNQFEQRIAERHDDEHRPCLTLRNQIVQNDVRAPYRRPGTGVIAKATAG